MGSLPPIPLELIMKSSTAFSRVIMLHQFRAVGFENHGAFVVVELPIHKFLVGAQIQRNPVMAGMFHFESIRDSRLLVIGKRQRSLRRFAGSAGTRSRASGER